MSFIGANSDNMVFLLNYGLIFHVQDDVRYEAEIITISIRIFNVILLNGIGHATEKEVFIIFCTRNNAIFK